MVFSDELRREILEQSTVSQRRLLQEARKRGLKRPLKTREAIVDWLLEHGLTFKQYEAGLNPPIVSRVQICKFFGLKKGWRVLDIGCGIAPIAPAITVGKKGKIVAVDSSEESLKLASVRINKMEFEETIQLRLGDVMNLIFDRDSFHIALLLYTPQFLKGFQELVAILRKIKEWTKLVGVADHLTVPRTYAESVFTLYSWIEHDVGRMIGMQTGRTLFPFHEDEIRKALEIAGWQIVKEDIFPALQGSPKNAIPSSVMMKNLDQLETHIEKIDDKDLRELYHSRILTLRKLVTIVPPRPSFCAILAER